MTNDQLNIAELPELPDPEGESRGCRFHTEPQIYAYALAAQAPLIERIKELENALTEVRHFFEAERKTISKGNGSQWAKWQCEEQMEAIDAALASSQGEQK